MNQRHIIRCGERLSIDQVERLHAEMEEAMRAGQDIQMDASQVQFCDTAGLQLLVALKRHLSSSECRFEWGAVSPCMNQISELLGLRATLELPAESEA